MLESAYLWVFIVFRFCTILSSFRNQSKSTTTSLFQEIKSKYGCETLKTKDKSLLT